MTATDGLSKIQFQRLAEEVAPPGGGFSIRAYGPNAGERPRSSFMVGGFGPTESHNAPVAADTIENFAVSAERRLRRPELNLGGWHDDNPERPAPEVDLDVSRAMPIVPGAEHAARRATLARGQMAYGITDEEAGYAGTVTNPFHPANKPKDDPMPHELAQMAEKNPRLAARQPEVQAWLRGHGS